MNEANPQVETLYSTTWFEVCLLHTPPQMGGIEVTNTDPNMLVFFLG